MFMIINVENSEESRKVTKIKKWFQQGCKTKGEDKNINCISMYEKQTIGY